MVFGVLFLLVQQPQQAAPRIEITPAQAEVQVGQSLKMSARVLDASGNPVPNAKVAWFGGGDGSVDSTGMVTGGFRGYVQVSAVAQVPGSKRAFEQIRVKVVPAPAAKLELAPWVSKLAVGTRITLRGTPMSAQNDIRYDAVAFSSSNPKVASVTPDGRVQAVAPGSATITGKAGNATASLAVQVIPAALGSLTITPGTAAVKSGDVVHFAVSAIDKAGKTIDELAVRWSVGAVSNAGVAQVDDDGAFVAEEQGMYTVTATAGGQMADAAITVTPRAVGRGLEVLGRVPIKFRGAEVWAHPDGKCVYYSTIADRLYAIDVADPTKPQIVDSLVIDARIINDVMTTEDGKYGVFSREGASNRKNGIAIFDASNSCHPKVIADYNETVSGGVHSSFVYQYHVYLTDDATGSMRVIDIKDPYHPREVARWQTSQTEAGRYVHDIDVKDGLAYLSYWNDGMIILDIGNGIKGGTPEKPVQVSQLKYDLDHAYRRVDQEYGLGARGTHTSWRHGKYVFIADEVYASQSSKGLDGGNDLTWGKLQVVDVSNIEKPKIVAWYEPTDGGVHNVWVAGDTLYMGSYQGGGRVLDISGELKGDLLRQGREMSWLFTADSSGSRPRSTFTWGAVVKNGLIYFNDINTGLWITRLESKQRPVP
ncbi:MAG: Ig-like domain-containing protein [Gemmatimonadota bacterium]